MTSVVDAWRAIDPAARLVHGGPDALQSPVRGVSRLRAAAPHLPPAADAQLLVVDTRLAGLDVASLPAALAEAGLEPAALLLAEAEAADLHDPTVPVLASLHGAAWLVTAAERYLADEAAHLAQLSLELRLACAEAALSDPQPAAPAGLVATRLRRGVAVAADGVLRAVHARPAGRMLAARFTALHARLLATAASPRVEATRRGPDGLFLMERQVRPGASVWLFDDLPFAAVDAVAADALRVTLRALLRRPPLPPAARPLDRPEAAARPPDELRRTLLAVARANGRVATAARSLGVHRNTVLYRLNRARADLGIDPRRPEDALRLLREAGDA
jgi:hypothetical protein